MDEFSGFVIKNGFNRGKYCNSCNMLLVNFKYVINCMFNKYCIMMEFIGSKEFVY